MSELHFEQGPIRPPSEAYSLLLRVTRNCPWNRCEFCHIYKGKKFSLRTVEEVKKDIDTVQEVVSEVKALSWMHGFGGEITAPLVNLLLQNAPHYPEGFRSVALWLYGGGETVFLQDANSLVLKTDQLVEILNYLKKTFPSIERITTYARAKTVSKKTVEELRDLGRAGISRIHMGLETGYDLLLQYIQKGVTAKEHIEAGKKVKESGISLSEYVILGLGGKGMWREHAVETAGVLNQIDPDFIRVRTLKVLKTMPLHEKIEKGEFVLLSDDEIVVEERLFIENLEGINSTFVSDHILNLLEEVEGKFPEEKEEMLARIDRYLALSAEEKANFRLGRRTGFYRSMDDLSNPELRLQVEKAIRRIELERPGEIEKVLSNLMESFI
ncbi:MAG: radical SAM protein [Desulfobacterales bacterium]|nr:radical SAM protein [Desulfobacterales bacterium]